MPQALVDESGQLLLDLHGTLSGIDPARWRVGAADDTRQSIERICRRLSALASERWPERTEAVRERLEALRERLESELPAEDGTAARMGSRWVAFRNAVTPAYEALSKKLREYEFRAPTLRPANYLRTFFHVMNAAVCIGILYGMPNLWWCLLISVPLFAWAWTVETLRRSRPEMNAKVMKFFGPIAHPYEYNRINSATWYVTAIVLLNLTMSPLLAGVSLAVVGVGDPTAGLIGRRFGRVKIMHGRTIEGSLAFVVAATVAAFGAGLLFAPTVPVLTLFAIALSAALAGAVAEIVSLRVDDNLSIALAAAVAVAIMAFALGVPLY